MKRDNKKASLLCLTFSMCRSKANPYPQKNIEPHLIFDPKSFGFSLQTRAFLSVFFLRLTEDSPKMMRAGISEFRPCLNIFLNKINIFPIVFSWKKMSQQSI